MMSYKCDGGEVNKKAGYCKFKLNNKRRKLFIARRQVHVYRITEINKCLS